MKWPLFFVLVLSGSMSARAHFDALPDSPLDTSMGDAAGDTAGTLNQLHPDEEFEQNQEKEKQEELLENRYDVPEDQDDNEFNKNGTNEP